MAEKDYSGTPLWKKLGAKEGSRIAIVGAPRGFVIEGPRSVRSRPGWPASPADVIVLFETSARELSGSLRRAKAQLTPAGGLWIAYPKKSSKLSTDLTFENVQRAGLEAGLVDNKSCAIDEEWSAVRFVYRLKDRQAAQSSRIRGRAKRP